MAEEGTTPLWRVLKCAVMSVLDLAATPFIREKNELTVGLSVFVLRLRLSIYNVII